MKQVLIPLIGAALFIITVGLFTRRVETTLPTPAETKEILINNKTLKVEVVDTEEERRKGLGGKSGLEENEGMLFVFEEKDISRAFWMKDMEFSIDIIWIDDGKIVQITRDVPPANPGTSDAELKFYTSNQTIDYVLEVNAGFAEKNQINVGDLVDLSNL